MTRIGLLSDTHSYLDDQIFQYFDECDEIWHAGDVGDLDVITKLQAFKPVRAVCGNIDHEEDPLPAHVRFTLEGLDIWITHIAGTPPRYNPIVRPNLKLNPPNILVCGHSHILKVVRDPTMDNMLFVNPGAAGKTGFHIVRTAVRFTLNDRKTQDMQVIELGKR
ncbi:MAG: metallophosphoesterase [Cytophagaceae bacterium]|nr:MAG: metallophosphoesterase [Cytophagaceae bacterium]